MSGQWPPEWEDSDTGLPDEWTNSGAGLDPEAAEVTLFLASVPSPVLPASFEARISAAIAAEATARADGTAAAGTGSAGAGMAAAETDDAKTTDRSSPPEFSPAAGSGSATAAKHRRRRTSTASGGADRRSRPTGSRPDGRRRRLRLPAPAVTGPLMILLVIAGFAVVFSQFGSSPTSSSSAASAASAVPAAGSGERSAASERNGEARPQFEPSRPGKSFVVTESGTRYQGSTLASQVQGQLDAIGPGAVTPASSVPNGGSTPAAAGTFPAASASASGPASTAPSAALTGCVSRLTGGVTPRLVDRASYDGIPAYIIAVPSRVWVVRLGCTAADPQEITSVSLTGLSRESQRPRIG